MQVYEDKCSVTYETELEEQCTTQQEEKCETKYDTVTETKCETQYETVYDEQCAPGDPASKLLGDRILNLGPLHNVKKHMYTYVSFLNSLTGLLAMLS